MAITPVGTPGVYENASSTAAVVPVPTGVQAGHLLVAVVEHSNVAVIATPSGWSADAQKSASASVSVSVFSRFATASEPVSYTFPTSATAGRVSGLMLALSGVNTTTWVDATPTSVAASGTQSTVPALTTATDGAYLLTVFGINASSSTDGVTPTGFTELARNAAAGSGVGRRLVAAGKVQSPAGPTGTVQWVTNPSASLAQVALLIPYRPAASGGGTTPVAPTASYSTDKTSGAAPLAVQFTDTSTGTPTSWAWDFGDGTSSTAQNPSHTYASAGTYTATLTATNAQGSTSTSKTITATSGVVTPTLLFRAVQDGGVVSVGSSNAVSVRTRASTDQAGTQGVIYSNAATPDSAGIAKPKLAGLDSTSRFYRVGLTDSAGNETWDTKATIGRIKVAPTPGVPTTLIAYLVACCNSSDSAAMAAIAARGDADLILHRGDKFYDDNGDASVTGMLNSLIAKQAAPNHESVYATTQEIYAASDHDASKTNNGNAANRPTQVANFNTAYDQLYATPPRLAGGHCYAKQWGTFLLINLDSRSFASPASATDDASKSLLGAAQEQWVRDTLATAKANGVTHVLILGDGAWVGAASAGDDVWLGYTTARARFASDVNAVGIPASYYAGDMHALATHDGVSGSVGGFPVFQSAPLYNASSVKGGPYTAGPYPTNGSTVQQYARIVLTDDGTKVTIKFDGYSADNTLRVTQTSQFSVPSGSGSASVAYTGTGAGTSPVVGANAGLGSGQIAYSGSGSGSTTRSGGGGAALAYGASGSGYTVTSGGGQGSLAYVGSGSGVAPSIAGKSGSGNAALAYTGSGSGSNGNQTGGLSILGKDGVWHGLTLSRV